jgi:hypothetical protein
MFEFSISKDMKIWDIIKEVTIGKIAAHICVNTNYQRIGISVELVRDDPKLLDDGVQSDTQISRKRLAVLFPAVKSPPYLTINLPGGQLPHVLWR